MKFIKENAVKDDGRHIVYYWFGKSKNKTPSGKGGTEAPKPSNGDGKEQTECLN